MRQLHSMSRRPSYGRHARRGAAPDVRPSPMLTQHVDGLRQAVMGHTVARRAEGARLEQVLAEISDLVELAERLEGMPNELGLLMDRVRLWSLTAYMDDPDLRLVPRFY